jgi:hypothetical protein
MQDDAPTSAVRDRVRSTHDAVRHPSSCRRATRARGGGEAPLSMARVEKERGP